jgi:hypothetical protein
MSELLMPSSEPIDDVLKIGEEKYFGFVNDSRDGDAKSFY